MKLYLPKTSSSFLSCNLLHLMTKRQQNSGWQQFHKASGTVAGQLSAKLLPTTSACPSHHSSQYPPGTTASLSGLFPLPMLHMCSSTAYSTFNPLCGLAATASTLKYFMPETVSRKGIEFDLVIHVHGAWKQYSLHSRQMYLKKGQRVGKSSCFLINMCDLSTAWTPNHFPFPDRHLWFTSLSSVKISTAHWLPLPTKRGKGCGLSIS